MQSAAEAPGIGRLLDRPRLTAVWTKMARLSDPILQNQRAQPSRLSAPALLLPSGIFVTI